jgi:hypothetical protein
VKGSFFVKLLASFDIFGLFLDVFEVSVGENSLGIGVHAEISDKPLVIVFELCS